MLIYNAISKMRIRLIKKQQKTLSSKRNFTYQAFVSFTFATDIQTIKGSAGSYDFFAPICSIRRLQFEPRK